MATGNYMIKARWEGNSEFNEAETVVNLALTPYSEQTIFSLTSNSTITEFAFNSTSKDLSFAASGPTGTRGYVSVDIPKSLISDISELKIYLDGKSIAYDYQPQTDSWVVSFGYTHSEHRIVIELGMAASALTVVATEQWITYTIVIGVAASASVAAAAIFYRRKRGNAKPSSHR